MGVKSRLRWVSGMTLLMSLGARPTYVAVYTAATGGTLKWSVEISPAITEIVAGARVFTNAGDITFQIPLS